MNTDIARYIDNARRSHRVSVWFANQARLGWKEARQYADTNRELAWEFLAEARRIKAGMEEAA